jgi:hypothetical protein
MPGNAKEWRANNKERVREYARNYARLPHVKAKVSEYGKSWRMKKRHGLTLEQYEQLAQEQDYRCKICGAFAATERHEKLVVDHCRATGQNRGLLCHSCNVALGLFKDNIDYLGAAINYLKSNS